MTRCGETVNAACAIAEGPHNALADDRLPHPSGLSGPPAYALPGVVAHFRAGDSSGKRPHMPSKDVTKRYELMAIPVCVRTGAWRPQSAPRSRPVAGVPPEINTTWPGLAGPGIRPLGVDNAVWSGHPNIRPAMMELPGRPDDHAPESRVLATAAGPGRWSAAAGTGRLRSAR
jgi:hypothetical protein